MSAAAHDVRMHLGSCLWSRLRTWNTDAEPGLRVPLGGHLVDLEPVVNTDGEAGWRVVEIHRGHPCWHVLTDGEVDWDHYDGLVNIRSVRGAARALNRAMAEQTGRGEYRRCLETLLAWSNAGLVR